MASYWLHLIENFASLLMIILSYNNNFMGVSAEPKANNNIKIYKYFKPRFINWLLSFNILFAVYFFTPLSLLQLLSILIIGVIVLKSLKNQWISSTMLIDQKECAVLISNRIDLQLSNFCWLINKINIHCFFFIFLLATLFYVTEKYLSVGLSWWIFGNLVILYLGATRYTKSVLKYELRLYREYKKYVIHVIEPNSPEREPREEDSESQIGDL